MQRQDLLKIGMLMSLGLVIASCGTDSKTTPTAEPNSSAQDTALVHNTATTAMLSGSVRDATGKAIPGAMITVTDDERGLGESVFSNDAGMFTLTAELVSGELELRVRKPYFADYNQSINLDDSCFKQGLTKAPTVVFVVASTFPG